MERPNNVVEGLVWLTDQINQSDVEFAPRFVVHNKNEHRIYFYSDKPNKMPQRVDDILETLTRTTDFTAVSSDTGHAPLTRERSNSLTGGKDNKPSTPGIPRRPSLSKRLKLQRASSLSEKKTDVRRVRDMGRSFKSLDSLDDIGVDLGEPGSVLELQRDPTPCVSIAHSSLMTRFIFTYCLRITVPPISCHNNQEEREECVRGASASKTLYIGLQTDRDMIRWLNSISSDLDRIRNRRFHVYPTLSVTVSEAKGLPPKKSLFCEVCLDSVPYSKTSEKLSNKGDVFWGEKYEFSEFPPVRTVSVLLYKGKVKRPQALGRVDIPALTLYGQGIVEKWYSLKQDRERRKSPATIRIKIQYQVLNILPFAKYEDLLNYVTDDYHLIINNLAPQLPVKNKDILAKNLVRMFYSTGDVTRYLVDVVVSEVNDPGIDSNLIFRGNSLATKSMDFYMRLVASDYLHAVLARPLVRYLVDVSECEVDPERIPNTVSPLQAQNNFLRHIRSIWEAIYKSRSNIPIDLQVVFHGVQTELGKEKQHVSNTVVIACIFLRFFCAAIMSPSLFDIIKEYPSDKGVRKLTLAAKTLQTLANYSRFEAKESYLTFLNGWLDNEQSKMSEFISYVSNYSHERRDSVHGDLSVDPTSVQIVSLGVELSTLHHFLQESVETVPAQKQEPLMPLTILLNALTCVESAFKESKDKFIWISSTPDKSLSSVGTTGYYKEPTANSLESESTGDEEGNSDIDSGHNFLNWPQKVPYTDLTWTKKDVCSYRESLSARSSAVSSSEDENPIPPPLPGRGDSFRETRGHTPLQRPSLELRSLERQPSLEEIENRLEAVQRSFKLSSLDTESSKPFIRRNSPNIYKRPSLDTASLTPSKSANQLPPQNSPPTSHNLSKHLSVDTSMNRFKNANEIRRNSNLYDRLPSKSEYTPKLQYSRSDSGESPRNNYSGSQHLPTNNPIVQSLRINIPNDRNGISPPVGSKYRQLGSTHITIEKKSQKSPTNQFVSRSTSIQVISKSPSPPQVPVSRFIKAGSSKTSRDSPETHAPTLDKWSSESQVNSIFSLPQRPSHPPKTLEVTQSLERINLPPKSNPLVKLTETLVSGHEKLERKLSSISGSNSTGDEECSYYRKECLRLQRDVTKYRVESQEASVHLANRQKEVDRWKAVAVQQAKELKKMKETSELIALNKQIHETRTEVLKLKQENEQLRHTQLTTRKTDNESLKEQIETWKGLAVDRLTRIRCLEASNATLMNGISQLETLQDIMTNGDEEVPSD